MATLVIQTGKHAGRKVKLPNHAVVIGRDEGCFLKLSGTDVSRKHCELKPGGGGWVVSDLTSQNGTFVNGQRITGPVRLNVGDDLLVGHMHFQWEGPKKSVDTASVLEESISDWLTERDTSLDSLRRARDGGYDHPHRRRRAQEPQRHQERGIHAHSAGRICDARGWFPYPSPPSAPDRRLPLADEAREVIRKFVEEIGDGKPPALAPE